MAFKPLDLIPIVLLGGVAYALNLFGFKNMVDNIIGIKSNILFIDYLSDSVANYTLADGQTSPNGNWKCIYTGFGQVGTRTASDGKKAIYMYPQVATADDQTHSSLVLSTVKFGNCEITLKMRTVRQLRTGTAPKNWETAWVMFRYNDLLHHYYFSLKMNGAEFGKKDNAIGNTNPEDQLILATPAHAPLVLGKWYDIKINIKGYHFIVYVDNVKVIDYTDAAVHDPAKMVSGSLGLYNEDSEVEFRDIMITI